MSAQRWWAARSHWSAVRPAVRKSASPFLRARTLMDELQRLVNLYETRDAASVKFKLDVLMDLERARDPRVVPFLLRVVADADENEEVRIHVVKQLRSGLEIVTPTDRPAAAVAIADILDVDHAAAEELRLQATLAFGDFAQVARVLPRLSAVALARDESIDLRYAAYTSIERAGPTRECIAVLGQLAGNETLGDAARSVLSAWHTA